MRKLYLFSVLIPALLALPASASAGELRLTMQNGLVTLVAEDVPLSAILAEWARIGKTQIVNGDKITTPVSLQIVDTPERRALDIVLRAASGYMVSERRTPVADASAFERIMILPTSRPPANSGPMMSPPPAFAPPRPAAPPVPDMDEEEPMPPGMNPQPQPQPAPGVPGANQPTQPQQTPGMPNAPLTSPRPGQLPAPQPNQPVPFGTPNKPGGGGSGGEGSS